MLQEYFHDFGSDRAKIMAIAQSRRVRACPGKVDPLFRQGHASQVFELARILFDQVIPPDRKAR
jgi:hypothetical protein